MWSDLLATPIANDFARDTMLVLLGITGILGFSAVLKGQLRRRTIIALVSVGMFMLFAYGLLEFWWKPFPDRIPVLAYLAVGTALFVFAAAIVQFGRRIVMTVATVIAVICAAGVVNVIYQNYPTVKSLNLTPVIDEVNYDSFERMHRAPRRDGVKTGLQVSVPITGEKSKFKARTAVAYIPPAYFDDRNANLPVVVMMAGNPGTPPQWFQAGDAASTMEMFQKAHNGYAPIVVSVDGTGSFTGNPLCIDGKKGNIQTYLTQDVPEQIKKKFRVNEDQRKWTIGGLSYGGTCSLQVVTNHPDAYGAFLDMSGQEEPTVGNHETTVQQFFNGDESAFQAQNPEHLLQEAIDHDDDKYHDTVGRFFTGDKDKETAPAMAHFHQLANEAGMTTSFTSLPGGHGFDVWREAFKDSLDFVSAHGDLKGFSD